MSSSSPSSDKDGPPGAAAKETESEDTETAAAETVSGANNFIADSGSVDTDAILSASSGERAVEAGIDTEDNEVSMDELKAAEASSESTPVVSASRPLSAEEAVEEYVTIGVVTGAERVVETTPVAATTSGGIVQGDFSGSGSHVDLSLLDSTPSTRQYVRRA